MKKETPYNILWFTSDMQRFDTIHCLNNPCIHTPNLDRLCSDGVAFTHTFCQNPVCTPSRSSFLTGRYPSSIRACMNGHETFSDAAPLIPKLLADNGYVCGLSGKLHLAAVFKGPEKRVEDGYSFFRYSHSPFARLDQGTTTCSGCWTRGSSRHRSSSGNLPARTPNSGAISPRSSPRSTKPPGARMRPSGSSPKIATGPG